MEVPVTDFALLSIFALVPLVLRWITTWQIGRFRAAACKSDGECRELAGQLSQVREAICDVERQQRLCASRRSHLLGQINAARVELAEMRRPAETRIAA